jgi:hypothetical protein
MTTKTAAKIPLRQTWPADWKPLTHETYVKVCAWRRDRSAFKGQANYTPRFESHTVFDIRERINDQGQLQIAFPYKWNGKLEHLKVLDITVTPVFEKVPFDPQYPTAPHGDVVVDYQGIEVLNEKGKVAPVRNISADVRVTRNPGVLFNAESLSPTDTTDITAPKAELFHDAFITEGEWDAMCLWEQGFKAVSVLSSGQSNVDPAILDALAMHDRVWIVMDNDKTGRKCSATFRSVIPNAQDLGALAECKDACSFYARYGGIALKSFMVKSSGVVLVTARDVGKVNDMPNEVFDGVLGWICQSRLSRFCNAYAWPSLLAAASTLVPDGSMRANLYVCLVGPLGSGKSQAAEWAQKVLGLAEPVGDKHTPTTEILFTRKIGSGEGLAEFIGDKESQRRLWYPGELQHTLGKAIIANASFPSVLQDAFYQDRNDLTVARQRSLPFSARLSIIGGVPNKVFGDVFGASTVGGLYARFILAQNPDGVMCGSEAWTGGVEPFNEPVPVEVDPEVWAEKNKWSKAYGFDPRVSEIAIRVAVICASFDGRRTLEVDALAPAFAFAKYQHDIRFLLRANEGETVEGKVQDALLTHLRKLGPKGEHVNLNYLCDRANVAKYGMVVVNRVIASLEFSHVVVTSKNKPRMIWLEFEQQ